MALFIRQTEDKSKLQERLAAELREKAKVRARGDGRPDGVEDSQYLKDTKPTTSLAWLWIVIFLLAIVALFVVIIAGNR